MRWSDLRCTWYTVAKLPRPRALMTWKQGGGQAEVQSSLV